MYAQASIWHTLASMHTYSRTPSMHNTSYYIRARIMHIMHYIRARIYIYNIICISYELRRTRVREIIPRSNVENQDQGWGLLIY